MEAPDRLPEAILLCFDKTDQAQWALAL